jgi:hypothetical protein
MVGFLVGFMGFWWFFMGFLVIFMSFMGFDAFLLLKWGFF